MKAIFEKENVMKDFMQHKEKKTAKLSYTDFCRRYKFFGVTFLRKYINLGRYEQKIVLFGISIYAVN